MAGIWRPRSAPRTRGPALPLVALTLLALGLTLSTPSASASPGWELILDRPSPSFQSIDFVSDDEGWLVAGAGLLHTTDGGETWEEAAPLTGIDVDFADPTHGWLVGYNGMIYGTTDGTSWREQTSGTSVHVSDVTALSPSEAWAVGSGEGFSDVVVWPVPTALLHTIDGGATWRRVQTPENAWFREITFVGEKGWALGVGCPALDGGGGCGIESLLPVMLHTADGGTTWSLADAQLPEFARGLKVVDELQAWLIGETCQPGACRSSVFHSDDGGLTWDEVGPEVQGYLATLTLLDGPQVWTLEEHCETGYRDCRLMLHTTEDGGTTWSSQPVGPGQGYSYALLATEDALYVTSQEASAIGGLALRSTDGGASWQPMEHPALVLHGLSFVDELVGYAISGGDLYRTEDAGVSWHRLGPAPGGRLPQPLEFLSSDRGFTAGQECTATICVFTIYRTDDGGCHWASAYSEPVDPGFSTFPIDLHFVDDQRGWLVIEGGFFFTDDGGVSWEQRPLGGLGAYVLDADLADAEHGWAIVAADESGAPMHGLIRTRDGGRTWEAVPGGRGPGPELVDFVDRDHGWYTSMVCGEGEGCLTTIFATEDGGERWKKLDARPRLAYTPDLVFVDRVNGWLNESRCDETGCTFEILHSPDGGRTWVSQLSDDLQVATFEFVDVKTGWLLLDPSRSIGIGGGPPERTLLYHTTDGGGGPIGQYEAPTPKFPDVGSGARGTRPGTAWPALLLGAIGVSLAAAGLLARLRRDS